MINTKAAAVTLIAGALIAAGPIVGAGSALADSPSPTADTLVLNEVASPMEDQRAIQNFTTQLGAATAIGGVTGGVTGVVTGVVVILLTVPAVVSKHDWNNRVIETIELYFKIFLKVITSS